MTAAALPALLLAVVAATAAPATSPAPAAAVRPSASATPAYGFVYRATPSPDVTPFPGPNPPAISEIDLSGTTLVTPGTIRVRVLTSDAVVSVAAETFGSSIAIERSAPGVFTLEGYVPAVPDAFKNRLYDVVFTASSADGRNARVSLPLMLK
ncbi:MAG: hypothetical protein NVSMB19_02340 [Vulcanimicrobiaceae bacterium]